MVTGVFLFTACTRGRPRALLFGTAGWLLLLLLQAGPPAMAQPLRDGLGKAADLPGWHIKQFGTVFRPDIYLFANWCAAPGDVNGDGYDDITIGTKGDSTYIFYGGTTLDTEVDIALAGGTDGIVAGDFNGDGLPDIATSCDHRNPVDSPNFSGMLRIYFRRTTPPYLGPEPDVTIRGDSAQWLGIQLHSQRPGMAVLDYNGDGADDLAVLAADPRAPYQYKVILYLGGAEYDTMPDGEFRDPMWSQRTAPRFAYDYIAGDLNGDGCDEIMIRGNGVGELREFWLLYLGNAEARIGEHDRILYKGNGWCPSNSGVGAIMDVDNDGYGDLLDIDTHSNPGDALLFRGSAVLPERIVPNDSIPNRDPGWMGDRIPRCMCPAGDMNGDGVDDLLVGWATTFFPDGTAYYLDPGGPDFRNQTGYFGTLPTDTWVEKNAYAVGDVNGDGCDDVVTLGRPSIVSERNIDFRFIVWLGSRNMLTGIEAPPLPSSLDVVAYPNPTQAGYDQVILEISAPAVTAATITLIDASGREMLRMDQELATGTQSIALPVSQLSAGQYQLVLRTTSDIVRYSLILQ